MKDQYVYQDGADFYPDGFESEECDRPSKPLYTASIRVRDFDTDAAKAARSEFEIWAAKQGIRPLF